jgi:Cellulose binding domain
MRLRAPLLLPLLLMACAAKGGAGDGTGGDGATSASSAGSAGAPLVDSSSGSSSIGIAGTTSAGAGDTAAGDTGAQAGAGNAGGGVGAGADSGGGSSGGNSGASNVGPGGVSGGNASGGGGGSMLQDGIQPYFKTSDTNTAAAISAILGEMHVVNTDGGNATLSLLKIRYYFTNEGTMPMMQMNWAHLKSPGNQLDVPFLATVVKMPTPKPMADSYIEFTCNSASILDAGKEAEISFRLYDGTNQPVFLQNNDYSFSATATPSDKIVLLYRDVVIWGVEP